MYLAQSILLQGVDNVIRHNTLESLIIAFVIVRLWTAAHILLLLLLHVMFRCMFAVMALGQAMSVKMEREP